MVLGGGCVVVVPLVPVGGGGKVPPVDVPPVPVGGGGKVPPVDVPPVPVGGGGKVPPVDVPPVPVGGGGSVPVDVPPVGGGGSVPPVGEPPVPPGIGGVPPQSIPLKGSCGIVEAGAVPGVPEVPDAGGTEVVVAAPPAGRVVTTGTAVTVPGAASAEKVPMPTPIPVVRTVQPEGNPPDPSSLAPVGSVGWKPAGVAVPKPTDWILPPTPTAPMKAGAGTV